MKSTVACLVLILAVASHAQFLNYGYAGFSGYGAYPGYPGYGAYPYDGLRSAYPGYSAGAGYPYYGYPAVTTSQYHAQDELGQARYGYAHPGQAAANYRDAFGNQIGSYAYFNPEGKEVRVSYTADHRGFRVLSNDLPVAPAAPAAGIVNLPVQVQDTPEVAAAKQDHALKWAAAKAATDAANAAAPVAVSRTKRQTYAASTAPLASVYGSPFGYNQAYTPLAYNQAYSPLAYSTPLGYNQAYTPLAYNQAYSPFAYNQAYTPLAYSSPVAYNQGPQFGYNFATQYPYSAPFATTPYIANSDKTSTQTA